MRIVVAGDDEIVLTGVRTALARDDVTIETVAAGDGGVRDLLALPRPDLYVVCLELITAETVGLLCQLGVADGSGVMPVLVLVASESEWTAALIRNGLCVLVRSRVHSDHLALIVMLLTAGYLPIPRDGIDEVLAHHADALAHPAADGTSSRKLTRREREVLELVRLGMTNPQIAEKLSIARSTVKSHIERILDKLRLRSRVEIILATSSGDAAQSPLPSPASSAAGLPARSCAAQASWRNQPTGR